MRAVTTAAPPTAAALKAVQPQPEPEGLRLFLPPQYRLLSRGPEQLEAPAHAEAPVQKRRRKEGELGKAAMDTWVECDNSGQMGALPEQMGSLPEQTDCPKQDFLSEQMDSLLEDMQVLKKQISLNQTKITENAMHLKCPLKEQKIHKEGAKKTQNRHLAMQMKRVARGSDGHLYDFEALRRYIMENYGTPLRSPVTGEYMLAELTYTEKCKQRDSKQTYRFRKWTPWCRS